MRAEQEDMDKGFRPADSATPGMAPTWWRARWTRRAMVSVTLVLLLILLHGPLLRAVYDGIVIDQPITSANYGVILFGDPGSLESVAESIREGTVRQAVIVEFKPSRADRIGATPRHATIAKEILKRKMLPETAIEVMSTDSTSHEGAIRELSEWMDAGSRATIYCPRHASRHLRDVIDAAVEAQYAQRMYVRALPASGFEEDQWWLSRTGIKRVVSAYLRLLHLHLIGLPDVGATEWDPDAYERTLRGNA